MERDCESELSKLNIEQNACIYHFGASVIHGQRSNILRLLQTYVNGIRIDINAVKNGIKLKYNNGLAEGSVNKIKVIKRIMYGRNSFDLLKVKVLLHEHFRCEFN